MAIVGLFGFFSLFGKNGLLEILRLKNMHTQVTQENLRLEEQQQALQQEIVRLHDPKYIEFLAREELGMIGENEYFILLDTNSESEVN